VHNLNRESHHDNGGGTFKPKANQMEKTDTFLTQPLCDRCNAELKGQARTMSWFTKDTICVSVCGKAEDKLKSQLPNGGSDFEGCGYIPSIFPEKVVTSGNGEKEIKYKIINNTAYKIDTPDDIVRILDSAYRDDSMRLTVDFGDTKTGKSWNEKHHVEGYIGKSTGEIKVPLLLFNVRSTGGDALLDNCVIRIAYSNKEKGGVLYRHPNYHN
jgi:hypothetical protein